MGYSAADESFTHQLPTTFDQVHDPDLTWSDRCYFFAASPDGTMLLASGYGNNPNTGTGLGYVKVSLADGRHWDLLAGRPVGGADRGAAVLGGETVCAARVALADLTLREPVEGDQQVVGPLRLGQLARHAGQGAEESGLADLATWPDAHLVQVVIVDVPAGKGEPAHEHADLRFLFATDKPENARAEHHGAPLRWLSPAEACTLTREANLRVLIGRAGRLLAG